MRHSIRSQTPSDHRDTPRSNRPARDPFGDRSTKRPERAVLAGVLLPNTKADLRNPLGELAALAESAGVKVVDTMIQKRTELSAAYALGKGRLAELVERVTAAQADVVIFDNDLAPRQIRGLEEAVGRKVIDRSELILDIFASRAKTREAQLQVELAQLEYTAPRLRGLWTHLERIAGGGGGTAAGAVGGVGTRGPGERQIEIDRRVIKERISFLKREIAEIDRRKQREVGSRSDQFTVSLVGYTNSGKSTLLNKLTHADQFVANLLFATLDTKTVRWSLGEARSALLSDTVGFIRDLPHGLVASFRATLEETIHADLLLHVVDISSTTAWQQMESVDSVLMSLGCEKIPQLTLLNKVDIADHSAMAEMLAQHRRDVLRISALTGEGLDELVREVTRRAEGDAVDVTIRVPHTEGKTITELLKVADVRERRYLSEGVELDVRINRSQLRQLQGRYPAMTVVTPEPLVDNPEAQLDD
jgi:GTP-binding protein HflX